jgi:hypothetical protein
MLRASPEVMPIPSFKGVRATCRNSAHDRLPSQPRHDAFDRRRVFALQMNNTKGRSVPAFFCQFCEKQCFTSKNMSHPNQFLSFVILWLHLIPIMKQNCNLSFSKPAHAVD